ncbi:hypothetical protein DF3PB_430011 [uncultured Defluviicoccus sp.]|uniref:Uncharacterized protein n=1 Tax=metagenome TaxID=256318 RepID=A0A380TI93_9ZZZZ|nr:hypothetical protein DF3PB_430011 [uncultured Defluviicoccus sp.]
MASAAGAGFDSGLGLVEAGAGGAFIAGALDDGAATFGAATAGEAGTVGAETAGAGATGASAAGAGEDTALPAAVAGPAGLLLALLVLASAPAFVSALLPAPPPDRPLIAINRTLISVIFRPRSPPVGARTEQGEPRRPH